ncbi:MAG: FAD:protein FMN transferase [Thermonemataceae bacterium]
MSNRAKNIIYSLVLLGLLATVYFYRKYQSSTNKETDSKTPSYVAIQGEAQGTTYLIKYEDTQRRNLQSAVDSLLRDFDQSLSTWQEDSDVSRFNRADTSGITLRYPYFYEVLQKSKEIYAYSEGAFDPTIAPLSNAWGFGFSKASEMTPTLVDSLQRLVSFDYITFDEKRLKKKKEGVMLDFNSIAQGYSVDVIANYFISLGIRNYMVELGGEVACAGVNEEGEAWQIGIKDPILAEKGKAEAKAIVALKDQSLATSGNYEKFYIKDGKKYTHILNPKTGYPVEHGLLSATVIAEDAITADAFATLCLVVGLEKSKEILAEKPQLSAYLIYNDEQGKLKSFKSEGIKKILQEF